MLINFYKYKKVNQTVHLFSFRWLPIHIFCAGGWHAKVKAVLALTSILTKKRARNEGTFRARRVYLAFNTKLLD